MGPRQGIMKASSRTIDEYLAGVGIGQRVALEALRRTIRSAAPKAEEFISYGIPAYRFNGMLVGFGATAKHCALYTMSGSTVEAFREELSDFDTSEGTIRFQPSAPIPSALVRKLVWARIAENSASPGR